MQPVTDGSTKPESHATTVDVAYLVNVGGKNNWHTAAGFATYDRAREYVSERYGIPLSAVTNSLTSKGTRYRIRAIRFYP